MVDLGTGRRREELFDESDESGELLEESQDTEITLGTGKLLGIFFVLVLVCAFFFTIGYMLGRRSGSESKTDVVAAAPTSSASAAKPSAVDKTASSLASPTIAPQPTPQPVPRAISTPTPAPAFAVATPAPSPEVIRASATGTYTVQIAAVSKQEDAQSLVSALLRKQYPAFVANVAGDALFHVQVGPFSDPKDAEIMRTRLAAEGYDAIVKK